jgi:hypothetical protein
MGAMWEPPDDIRDAQIEAMCRIDAEYRRTLLIGRIVLGVIFFAVILGLAYCG